MGSIGGIQGGSSTGGSKKGGPGSSGGVGGLIGGSLGGGKGGAGKPGGGKPGGSTGGSGSGMGGGKLNGSVGGVQQGSGLKKGAVNSGTGGVVGTGKGFSGKGTGTLGGIDQAGNQVFSQIPANAQSWVQTQAGALAGAKRFSQAQHHQLLHKAAAAFPQVDPNLVVALIRFRALQHSAGGSIHSLYAKSGGPTAFQTQLIRGGG